MDLTQLLESGNTITLIGGCALLCILGGGLFFILQLLGGFIEIFAGIFEFLLGIVSGGPVAWCGCIVLLFACALCGFFSLGIVSAVQSCGTPDAVNLCRILGY